MYVSCMYAVPCKFELAHELCYYRGEVTTEGWLVLTNDSLSFYDRDPRRVTRKPLTTFLFDSSVCAFVVSDMVDRKFLPYASPSRKRPLAFIIEQHSAHSTLRAIFIASSLQSKEEWVREIESVITKTSQMLQTSQVPRALARELKSVSIVPVKPPRHSLTPQGKSGASDSLELSITSSMFDSPSSTSVV